VGLAHRFLWNRHDAEDAVQNALLLAERKHGQLRRPELWWPWLCRIVVQQCRLIRRQNSRQAAGQVGAAEALRWRGSTTPAQGAGSGLEDVLHELIGELPRGQRTAIVLRHLEGMDYEEIAQVLGRSESTVRVHVKRAREALREAIRKRYPEWSSDQETD